MTLAFPRDGGVVMGVTIEIGADQEADTLAAEGWMVRLLEETGAQQGFVHVEEPPSLTEAEWQDAMGYAYRTRSAGPKRVDTDR